MTYPLTEGKVPVDNTKLNALAAKVMGWHRVFYAWESTDDGEGDFMMKVGDWNPSTCADDALMLLQKATGIAGWSASFNRINTDIFSVSLLSKYPHEPVGANQKTLPLAMTLRAAGIPETEIADALK